MSRGQSPSSISQSSSFSVDQTVNPYVSSYPQYYGQYYPPAGPSTVAQPTYNHQPNFRPVTVNDAQINVSATRRKYSAEENDLITKTQGRCLQRLKSDHDQVLDPAVETPFVDAADVVKKLLPYHVFQQPGDDLAGILKGKQKAGVVEDCNRTDIADTRFALECLRRQAALKEKYHRILLKSAKRSSPDDQSYFLEQMLIEQDRTESALLSTELRSVRADLEKIERERRAAVTTYYRPYPYSYAQTYTGTIQPTSQPVQMVAPPMAPAPTFSSTPSSVPTTAIPVQLPVSSLPALHALGIIPVPATSLPQDGQAQSPAVLRGSTANGTMLSLEINVSLLHSAQMSGLALVLNSLVNRSTNTASTSSSTPVATQPVVNGNGTSAEGNKSSTAT